MGLSDKLKRVGKCCCLKHMGESQMTDYGRKYIYINCKQESLFGTWPPFLACFGEEVNQHLLFLTPCFNIMFIKKHLTKKKKKSVLLFFY